MTQPSGTPSLPPHLEPLRAALASQYEIQRTLGAGGMGTVVLARDLALDRLVAIKVVSTGVMVTTEVRERFLREARTVARLRHPNIVAVHSAGETQGILYFVMEYVEGESLRERMQREGTLPAADVERLVRELADALDHAHAAGIVHRDIKPENVLLERGTGTARLTDFGVARAFTEVGDDRLTGTGMAIGTPRYMSPEQATGERQIDGRSDIYSLGLLGYEALTGGPVFAGSGPSMLAKQITERPDPVSSRAPSASPTLAAVIDKALEKDPALRWPTGGAMRDALTGQTPIVRAPVRRRRARTLVPLATAAVLITVGVLSFAWRGLRGAGRAADQRQSLLVLPFANMSNTPDLDWLREGSVSMLTFDMSQWRDLSVVGFERTLDLVREADEASRDRIGLQAAFDMAEDVDASSVVMGDFQVRGDSLFVTGRLYEVGDDEPVQTHVVRGPKSADPRSLFDQLSRDLLGSSAGTDFAARRGIAAQTTSSLEAWRHYVRGVTFLTSWRLDEADSAFALAIAADSTFSLAYYKRSIGQGWRTEIRDSTKRSLAQLAVRHASKLPDRERQLINAYAAFSEQRYDEARETYSALVARDSTDAEAWYGLADAAYHSFDFTTALRAFEKALEFDPTLHLAYAHEVDLFVNAAHPTQQYVLIADSVLYLNDPQHRAAYPNADSIAVLRRVAAERAVGTARAWRSEDPRAAHAHLALANALIAAGELDEAEQTLRGAMSLPDANSPSMHFRIAALRMRAGRSDALATLRAALDSVNAASLRGDVSSNTGEALISAFSVAGYGGSPRALGRVTAIVDSTIPTVPTGAGTVSSEMITRPLTALNRLAMGDDSPSSRRQVEAVIRMIEAVPDSQMRQGLRQQWSGIPYLAYLMWRDDEYHAHYNAWTRITSPTLAVMAALAAGDSARARQLADSLPGPETVGTPSESSLRVIGSVALFLELGDHERALAYLERMDPHYYSLNGPELRWAFLPRSYFVRGTIYERLGQREKATEAYQKFLELWKDADPELGEQVRAARAALGRLRDPSR